MPLLDFMNSIPIVGHGKGLVHYLVGDAEGGNRAMKESSRTTLIMGAGAVGCVAGPVGAAALASATGATLDAFESLVTGKATGLVAGIENIVDTASEGSVPIGGILQATLSVAGDAVGGLGGGSIASSVSATLGRSGGMVAAKNVGKSIVESSGKEILKSASIPAGETFGKSVVQAGFKLVAKESTRVVIVQGTDAVVVSTAARCLTKQTGEFIEEVSTYLSEPPPRSPTSQQAPSNPQNQRSSSPSSGGSGQQPPRRNPNSATNSSHLAQTTSVWKELLKFFKVQSLDEISIRNQNIFRGLSRTQKNNLKNLLNRLNDSCNLRKKLGIMVNIFKTVDLEEVTFGNFLSLGEIVLQFTGERAARINERHNSPNSYDQRRREVLRIAGQDVTRHDYTILRVFEAIRAQIELRSIPINFRNIFAAVYHYFKHRRVGDRELSVEQYYDLIRINLEIISQTTEYRGLTNNGRIVFERNYAEFGTTLLIAISMQEGRVYLRTCFFLDEYIEFGEDGAMRVNGRRL